MKKFFMFLFVAFLALALVACGEPSNSDNGGNNNNNDNNDNKTDVKRDVKVEDAGLKNVLGEGTLYVTTFGQADWAYIKTIVTEAVGEGAFTENNQLQASDVNAGDVVVAVVGFTTKGIAAEITQTGEVNRAKAMAEKEGITLILVQLSGKDRRGESSDPIIEAAVKGSDYVLIYDAGNDKGANFDGKYTTWCKDNENFFMFSDEYDTVDYIKALVGKN